MRRTNTERGPVNNSWRVRVDERRSFEIREVNSMLEDGASEIAKHGNCPGRRLILMDSQVYGRWAVPFEEALRAKNIDAVIVSIAGGEREKNMDLVLDIVQRMKHFGLDRKNEPLIVVGGGALLDAGGFAASMYRRGVPYIRVPTTVLAYVDASVGIKTGVNVRDSKNIVGSFHPPLSVLLDRAFFETLPKREFSSGQGEILKLAIGCDLKLFRLLEEYSLRVSQVFSQDDNLGTDILNRSVSLMVEELRPNLFEDELRRNVDLGHTFSQPLEMSSGLRHGEAVGLDLLLSSIISSGRGFLRSEEVHRIFRVAAGLGLPTRWPSVDPELLWSSLLERTEHRGGSQHAPIPRRIGGCTFLEDICREEVYRAVCEVSEYSRLAEGVKN